MEITVIDKTKAGPFPVKCYKHHKEYTKYEDKSKAPPTPLAEFYVTRELKNGSSVSVPLCAACMQELCVILDHKVLQAAILEQELAVNNLPKQ